MVNLGFFTTSRAAGADLRPADDTAAAGHGRPASPTFTSAVANLLQLARVFEEPSGEHPGSKSLWPAKSLAKALDGLSADELINLPNTLSPDNHTASPQAKTRAQIIEQVTIAFSKLPKGLSNDRQMVAKDTTGKAISLRELIHSTRDLHGVVGDEQVASIKAYIQNAARRICEYHHAQPDYTDFGYHQREQQPHTRLIPEHKSLAHHLKKKMPGYKSKQAAKLGKLIDQQDAAARRLLTIGTKNPFAGLQSMGDLKNMIRSHESFQATGSITHPHFQRTPWQMSLDRQANPREDWQQVIHEDGNPAVNAVGNQFCIPRRAVCPLTDLIDSVGLLAGISGADFQKLAKQYSNPAARQALHQSIKEKGAQAMTDPLAEAQKKRLEAIEIMTRPIGYPPARFSRSTITLLELDDLSLFENPVHSRPDGNSPPRYTNLDAEIPDEVRAQLSQAFQDARALLEHAERRVSKTFPPATGIKKATMVERPASMQDGSMPSLWTVKHPRNYDAVQQILDMYASLPNTWDTAERKRENERRLQEWLQLGSSSHAGATPDAADSANPITTILQETVHDLRERFDMVRQQHAALSQQVEQFEGINRILATTPEMAAPISQFGDGMSADLAARETAQDFHQRLDEMRQQHEVLSQQLELLAGINRIMGEAEAAEPVEAAEPAATTAETQTSASPGPADFAGAPDLSLEEADRDFRERQLPELARQLKELTDRIEQFDGTGGPR